MSTRRQQLNYMLPYIAWFISLVSVVGSLFFSEIMLLPPCILCWYQRIAMYPLVLTIGAGIISGDYGWKKYSLPLSLTGLAISIYHNLLYYGFIPESITPCSEGVPCNAVQIEWLEFITIPVLGLLSFASITACLMFYRSERPNYPYEERD